VKKSDVTLLIPEDASARLGRVTNATGQLQVGDISVAYREHGAGDPVLLVHGLAQDLRSWAAVQADLADWRTIAYDLRGHGETSLGDADGTLEQLGLDLVGLLEQLGPAVVAGFSLGGTVALWAAARRPDLVSGLVVLGTSSAVGRSAADFYGERIELFRAGDRDAMLSALRDDSAPALATSGVDLDALARERLEAVGDGGGYCSAAAAMARLRDEPLTPDLGKIAADVLVVGGEHDSFCPRRAADIMLGELPSAKYVEIPGAGHLMAIDAPEATASAIRDYLRAHAADEPAA
jgi:pimeloyl-ACP methyl ester carboxylesterase